MLNYKSFNKLFENNNINTFEKSFYTVYITGDDWIDNIYDGYDKNKAYSEFKSIDTSDNRNKYQTASVILEERIQIFEFIGKLDNDETIEDIYPFDDFYNDEEIYSKIEEKHPNIIEEKEIPGTESTSDNNLQEIQTWLKNSYNRDCGFYNSIILGFDKDNNNIYMQIRVKEHSENPRNRRVFSLDEHNLSIVIANKDATKDRFHSGYELYFDGSDDLDDIKNEIFEYIQNTIDLDENIVKLSDECIEEGHTLN